jgi:hypothetical protein
LLWRHSRLDIARRATRELLLALLGAAAEGFARLDAAGVAFAVPLLRSRVAVLDALAVLDVVLPIVVRDVRLIV